MSYILCKGPPGSRATSGTGGITVQFDPDTQRWQATLWQDGQLVCEFWHMRRRSALQSATARLIRLENDEEVAQ